jgi:MOSC domain-containing protein YiiM
LFSLEVIERLRGEGHPIGPGTTGENITVEGLDWSLLVPGARLRIGDARVELTRPAAPCKNIAESFAAQNFQRISDKTYPGWSRYYARVLEEGAVRAGDPVVVEPLTASATDARSA